MKILVFILILFPNLVSAETSGFIGTPNLAQLMEFPFETNPEWPLELISITNQDYERNPRATFCLRPPEMIDTIVIHHSETSSTTTPQQINQLHLNRGTSSDPWYMIAYSYVVNTPYPQASIPNPKITVGRPLEIVGAHAGSDVFVAMSEGQKKMWNEGKVVCGKENEDPQLDETLLKGGKIKANVTTIGVVINGNYSPFSKINPGGYSKKNPRYPTKNTQDMIARLSCQLQKKYPRIKNIKWHSYYHSTSCPGSIKNYIGQIKTLAEGYGCEFN